MIDKPNRWSWGVGCAALVVLTPLGCNLNPLTEDPGFGSDETPSLGAEPSVDGLPSMDNGSVVTPGPAASAPGAPVIGPAPADAPELIVDGAEPGAPPSGADPGPESNPVTTVPTPPLTPAPTPTTSEPTPPDPPSAVVTADAGAPDGDASALEATTFGTMDATLDDGGP